MNNAKAKNAKKQAPIAKNADIELSITGQTSDGSGIGRVDGYAVFVPYALPGETVNAHVIKVTSGYAVAKLTSITEQSPYRVTPRCPQYARCGGCTIMHQSYEKQLELKRNIVKDAFARIGGMDSVEVNAVIGMNDPWKYRNKGSFPFAMADGKLEAGFYAPRSHRLVPCRWCSIQDDGIMTLLRAVRQWAEDNCVSAYDEEKGEGALRHAVIRATTEGYMAVIVTRGELPEKDKLIEALSNANRRLVSIVHNVNPDDTNVIFGRRFETVYGPERVIETILGIEYAVSAETFLQVNHEQTEKLYSTALDLLAPKADETIADVYCGMGAITLHIAKACAHVTGIESVDSAVSDARKNAKRNGIANADFIAGAAEKMLPELAATGQLSAICLDPPRSGCERAVLDAIGKSNASRVVYISCDPATLARDCGILASYGYKVSTIQPVDMFPQSQHVETVCLLSRK